MPNRIYHELLEAIEELGFAVTHAKRALKRNYSALWGRVQAEIPFEDIEKINLLQTIHILEHDIKEQPKCITCQTNPLTWDSQSSSYRTYCCGGCKSRYAFIQENDVDPAIALDDKAFFIAKARSIHGDKYDYSGMEYVKLKHKYTFVCREHGPFQQNGKDHLAGNGCQTCGAATRIRKKSSTKDEFIANSRSIHGDKYDYSLVEYVNSNTKVKIICPEHGEFMQNPNNHLGNGGSGCYECGLISASVNSSSDTKTFIERAKVKHHNKYTYGKVEYVRSNKKVIITCPTHGEFTQTPGNHLSGYGCKSCAESTGERDIRVNLDKHGIAYLQEHTFDDLRNPSSGRRLYYDFVLPDYKVIIEFNGMQHYQPVNFGSKTLTESDLQAQFEDLVRRDEIKKQYAWDNGYTLYCIKYTEQEAIPMYIQAIHDCHGS